MILPVTLSKLKKILIFENDDFLVINKPPGLLSIPDREGKELSLKMILQQEYAGVYTVHRLDRETSGLILFAKNEETHKHLSQQFEHRYAVKYYCGLAKGSLPSKKGSINFPIEENPSRKGTMAVHKNGKEALTDYEVIEDFKICTWARFRIHTGRTHQIRVHMQAIGHPLLCDPLYGDGNPFFVSDIKYNFRLSKNQEEEKPILGRLALHASELSFKNADNQMMEFEAPLPKDLKATLQQLNKIKTKK